MNYSQWLREDPFHLTLSSGFFGFYAHAGVLKALIENNHAPSSVSGASAGALVASLWASGMKIDDIEYALFALKRAQFWDPISPLGLLRGKKFMHMLREMMPEKTFETCRTKLAVSAFDVFSFKTKVFDSGNLTPAVYASCAVPGLFQPAWIGGRPYYDGGLLDRPGLLGAPKNCRILYHHLLSRRLRHARQAPATYLPTRENLKSVVIDTLPAVNPFKLHAGPDAFYRAYEHMSKQLEI